MADQHDFGSGEARVAAAERAAGARVRSCAVTLCAPEIALLVLPAGSMRWTREPRLLSTLVAGLAAGPATPAAATLGGAVATRLG